MARLPDPGPPRPRPGLQHIPPFRSLAHPAMSTLAVLSPASLVHPQHMPLRIRNHGLRPCADP